MNANNIHFIINPVSGRGNLHFQEIGNAIQQLPMKTTLHITREDYSATDCVKDALSLDADLVIAYGGDGTVMEVANALHGHDIPMGIIPGGTANVTSHELGIPQAIQAALNLIFHDEHQLRQIDAGRIGDDHFLLRTSIGWEAELSQRPSREEKTSWGPLAYTHAALEALQDMQPVTYHITLDDDTEHEIQGINCSICNIGNVGVGNINISLDIMPDDGLLNVLILQNQSIQAMLDITQNMLASSLPFELEERLAHFKAKKITVNPDAPQRMSHDGEPFEHAFPITFTCVPNYISIITPKS